MILQIIEQTNQEGGGEVRRWRSVTTSANHDDVIKWKHFPRYWTFVRGIPRSPVNSPHRGQWRGALMFSLICVWVNGWINNGEAGDLRCYCAHYDVTVMTALTVTLYALWACCHLGINLIAHFYTGVITYPCPNRNTDLVDKIDPCTSALRNMAYDSLWRVL